MRYFLYGHNGSGNHGCEAIVRSTSKILKKYDKSAEIFLASGNSEEDIEYNLNEVVEIIDEKNKVNKLSISYILAYVQLKLFKNDRLSEELCYKKTFNNVGKNTIALSIGGDNYCYPGYQRFIMLHRMLSKKGVKTVLWGCSVEPSKIDEDMRDDLCKYDLIIARESLTYGALKEIGANVCLYPDPAFQLNIKKGLLPENFIENKTVGINISPMIINNENVTGITMKNYIKLIEYILRHTEFNIALIPHVIWEDNNDDRIPLGYLYNLFKNTNRICFIDDTNCEIIKWYISKCKYFIGARTHSTIAAYSTLVPTLTVGYSIKARGIAKDIFGTEKNYVIPVQNMNSTNELIDGFKFIMMNENDMREKQKRYITNIPDLSLTVKKVGE